MMWFRRRRKGRDGLREWGRYVLEEWLAEIADERQSPPPAKWECPRGCTLRYGETCKHGWTFLHLVEPDKVAEHDHELAKRLAPYILDELKRLQRLNRRNGPGIWGGA